MWVFSQVRTLQSARLVLADDRIRPEYLRSMQANTGERGNYAECELERLLSAPLISESVYRGAKYYDNESKKRQTKKELIDFFLLHKGSSVLISSKAQ
jgi:predicted thioredoxin/glutaredoxin